MRRKLPWFLLAASVALNVFFVAGLFYPHVMGHWHGPHGRDHMALAAREFGFNEQQMQALDGLRERIAERRRERGRDRASFRAIIIDSLRSDSFDRASIAETLQARRGATDDMIVDVAEELHGVLAGLPPERKTAFLNHAEADREVLRRLLFPRRSRN